MKHIISICLLWLCQLALFGQAQAQTYTADVYATPRSGGTTNIATTIAGEGDSISLYAYPAYGYEFKGWQVDGVILSEEAFYMYIMPDRDVVIEALFKFNPANPGDPQVPVEKFNLTVSASPKHGGSFNVTSTEVGAGQEIYLEAYPYWGFVFKGWMSGDSLLSVSESFVYRMGNADAHLTGVFVYDPQNPGDPDSPDDSEDPDDPVIPDDSTKTYTVNVSGLGGGIATGSGTYAAGAEAVLEALPDEGYSFVRWSDGVTDNPYKLIVDKDTTLKATFAPNVYMLYCIIDSVLYDSISVVYGAVPEVPVVPEKEGYTFSGWEGVPATMPARNVTVSGSYVVNVYNIVYYVNGNVYCTVEVPYGARIELIDDYDGQPGFSGWSAVPEFMPAHDLNVYATLVTSVAEISIDRFADAYSPSGVLVKKQVDIECPADYLAPGLYIIGGRKVVVGQVR